MADADAKQRNRDNQRAHQQRKKAKTDYATSNVRLLVVVNSSSLKEVRYRCADGGPGNRVYEDGKTVLKVWNDLLTHQYCIFELNGLLDSTRRKEQMRAGYHASINSTTSTDDVTAAVD